MAHGPYVQRKECDKSPTGKHCRCGVLLTNENWYPSCRKVKRNICKACLLLEYRTKRAKKQGISLPEYDAKNAGRIRKNNPHCRTCDVPLTNGNWRPSRKRTATYYCDECYRKRTRLHYNAQADRLRHIKHEYGLSEVEYERLWGKQRGLCVICDRPLTGKIVVDHNHVTRTVRGLAHNFCNIMLGYAKEDPTFFEHVARVLRQWDLHVLQVVGR